MDQSPEPISPSERDTKASSVESRTVLDYEKKVHNQKTKSSHLLPIITAIAGFSFGLILSFIGILMAGGGHGSYVLIGLVSSPLGVCNILGIAWLGTPFLWATMGILAATSDRARNRIAFVGTLVCHYLCLPIILGDRQHFGDWYYVKGDIKDAVYFGFILYAFGQIFLWAIFTFVVHQMVVQKRRA